MRSSSTLVVFATVVAASLAVEKVSWDHLSVTWGLGGYVSHLAGKSFYSLPLKASDAAKQDWVKASTDDYTTLWCLPDDPRVCVIYDLLGNVAGIQICYPVADLKGTPYDWTQHSLFHAYTIFGQDVACGRIFLVSQETLKKGGRSVVDEIGTGAWLHDGDNYVNVPQDATQLETGWTKESCIPTMGRHYYYNVTDTMDCRDFEPFFVLTNDDKNWVHGFGFQSFGRRSQKKRDWQENVPSIAIKPTIPNTPKCLIDWAASYGVLSVHVYFIKNPYFYLC